MTAHIQAWSQRFSEPGTSVRFSLDQKTLAALVALLSHSLQAAITGHDFKQRRFMRGDGDGEEGADLHENIRKGSFMTASCQVEGPVSAPQVVQLVTDVLEVSPDLMLVGGNKQAAPLLTFRTHLHSSDYLVPSLSRRTSYFTAFRSIESTATSLLCAACAKTKPPQSSAGTQQPSTCRPPSSCLCSFFAEEKPKAGRVSRACSPF